MKKTYWLAALLLVVQTLALTPQASASARATKKIGLDLGIITEPFPSVLGFSASYNVAPFLRLTGGYGTVSVPASGVDVTTVAFDAKVFPLDWNFAPFADIGYTNVSGSVGAGSSSVKGSGAALDYGFGIDWQTYLGFNFGVEYKLITLSGTSTGLPGVYFGWFF